MSVLKGRQEARGRTCRPILWGVKRALQHFVADRVGAGQQNAYAGNRNPFFSSLGVPAGAGASARTRAPADTTVEGKYAYQCTTYAQRKPPTCLASTFMYGVCKARHRLGCSRRQPTLFVIRCVWLNGPVACITAKQYA